MSDIHDCYGCREKVYMGNAEHCVVCDSYFCGACDYENGEKLWDDEKENCYYVCKDCLGQGLDYINEENEDDATITKEEYDIAVKELDKKINSVHNTITFDDCKNKAEELKYCEYAKEHKFKGLAMKINKEYSCMCSNNTCGECKYAFMENCKTLFILDYLENKNEEE